MTGRLEIQPFDPATATEAALESYYLVWVAGQAVDRPDEPRLTYDNFVGRLNNPFTGVGPVRYWTAGRGDTVVGIMMANFPEEENSRIAIVDITVHPEHRRRGTGTAMLAAVLPELRARGREVVEGWQLTKGGDGEKWAQALRFTAIRGTVMQMLAVPEADRSRWRAEVPPGYRLERWRGTAPDDLVGSYAHARGAIHDAPLEDSGFVSPQWTVERVRETEAELRSRNVEQRVVVAVHEVSGAVVGLTELERHPHRPHWGYQRDTAVLREHRGHGLGNCMKGLMIRWLLEDGVALERIYTSTGSSNTHMIRVNHQLGFTTVRTMVAVSREVSAIATDLAAAPDLGPAT